MRVSFLNTLDFVGLVIKTTQVISERHQVSQISTQAQGASDVDEVTEADSIRLAERCTIACRTRAKFTSVKKFDTVQIKYCHFLTYNNNNNQHVGVSVSNSTIYLTQIIRKYIVLLCLPVLSITLTKLQYF